MGINLFLKICFIFLSFSFIQLANEDWEIKAFCYNMQHYLLMNIFEIMGDLYSRQCGTA